MPGPNFVLDKGFLVQAAASKGTVVKIGTVAESVTPVTGTNDAPIGVLMETVSAQDVTDGRIANVRLLGIARVVAQAAITRGTKVRAHSSGKVTTLAGTAGLVENIVGIALSAAGADGDHMDVLLTIGSITNTAAS